MTNHEATGLIDNAIDLDMIDEMAGHAGRNGSIPVFMVKRMSAELRLTRIALHALHTAHGALVEKLDEIQSRDPVGHGEDW